MTKKGGKAVCFGDSCFLRFGSKVIGPQTFEVQLSTPTLMPSDWTSSLSVGNGRISLVCSPFQELCSQFQFVETIKLQSHNRSLYENRSTIHHHLSSFFSHYSLCWTLFENIKISTVNHCSLFVIIFLLNFLVCKTHGVKLMVYCCIFGYQEPLSLKKSRLIICSSYFFLIFIISSSVLINQRVLNEFIPPIFISYTLV